MKMREEYERVQQKLKEEMKEVGRQSPMERLRNFFRGKVKEGKHAESRDSGRKTKQTQDTSLGNRPASSLSIQSISSECIFIWKPVLLYRLSLISIISRK